MSDNGVDSGAKSNSRGRRQLIAPEERGQGGTTRVLRTVGLRHILEARIAQGALLGGVASDIRKFILVDA